MKFPAAAFFCVALFAQTDSPQVAGRVIDAVTGAGVAGANITLYTYQSERYRAVTDDSGAFQLSGADKGQYEVAVEKSGFLLFAKSLQIGEGITNPIYELEFSETPTATLRGSVLDSQGKPLANTAVDLIRGPSLAYRKITDSEGRFSFDKLGVGSYKLRAAPPPNHPGFEVATYFPGWVDESAAGRFELKGDAEVNGFRLATAPGVHLRGIVRDEDSHPVANATVKLHPVQQQPAHVVVSFDSTFLAVSGGTGVGPAEVELRTDAEGAFDFPSVRAGGWQIVARSENLSGSVSVSVANEDVRIDAHVKAPITISSVPIKWVVWECRVPPNPMCDFITPMRKAPAGAVYPIWFYAVDGQPSVLRSVMTGSDSTSDLTNITPGRFVPFLLPTRAPLALPSNSHLWSSLRSSSFPYIEQIDSRAVPRGQQVNLDRGSSGLALAGGGHFDGDGILPRYELPQPGRIHGTVTNSGAGVTVVIAKEERGRIWGQLAVCHLDGTFDIDSIGDFGDYGIAAFRTMDMERMRDPSILQKVLASRTKVRVLSDATAEIRLSEIF